MSDYIWIYDNRQDSEYVSYNIQRQDNLQVNEYLSWDWLIQKPVKDLR